AGARICLLDVLDGEHAKKYGNTRLQTRLSNAARGILGDEVEMHGLAADHGSERDHSIVFRCFCSLKTCKREFECTGDFEGIYHGGIRFGEGTTRSRKHLRSDMAIPAAHDDREPIGAG